MGGKEKKSIGPVDIPLSITPSWLSPALFLSDLFGDLRWFFPIGRLFSRELRSRIPVYFDLSS